MRRLERLLGNELQTKKRQHKKRLYLATSGSNAEDRLRKKELAALKLGRNMIGNVDRNFIAGQNLKSGVEKKQNTKINVVAYINGRIYTVDSKNGVNWDKHPKEAMVIENEKIVFVGNTIFCNRQTYFAVH